MRRLLIVFWMLAAAPAVGEVPNVRAIVEAHVLPGYETLAEETLALSASAAADCSPQNAPLITVCNRAFDAWVGVSHLRFGPSEENNRAFALAFWPDPRGSTPKALATLIRERDPVIFDPSEFEAVSVAARGFYALEFLLFDPQFAGADGAGYRCALIRAIAADAARNAAAILDGWHAGYAGLMSDPGNDVYRTPVEAAQQFFTALSSGLEFTSDARLGRPLGTFDRPRPNRAEARRSGRSLRHVLLSLGATRDLAAMMSMDNPGLDQAFEDAMRRAEALDDPVFAGVSDAQGRFRVEALKQDIDEIRDILGAEVGPSLGIAAGFNALDGD